MTDVVPLVLFATPRALLDVPEEINVAAYNGFCQTGPVCDPPYALPRREPKAGSWVRNDRRLYPSGPELAVPAGAWTTAVPD